MVIIDASKLTTEALQHYDDMMVECSIRIARLSGLALNIWGEVLRELDLRGEVHLVSGAYDDIGNSRIKRNWLNQE